MNAGSTSQAWHSLFVPQDDTAAVIDALRRALEARGYKPYDPFPGGTGLSAFLWKVRAGHFVVPSAAGWTRVLGEPDPAVLPELAAKLGGPLLHVWLAEDDVGCALWSEDGRDDSPEALAGWLRDGVTPEALARAWAGNAPVEMLPQGDGPAMMAVPLTDDMKALAESVDQADADKLMEKLTKSVFGKLGGQGAGAQAQAQAMLGGGSIWNTEGGRWLRGILACLTIPEGWREPSFADLRGAYQVARSRQHRPDGVSLPGDDEALALVPDALDFTPVYAGKR